MPMCATRTPSPSWCLATSWTWPSGRCRVRTHGAGAVRTAATRTSRPAPRTPPTWRQRSRRRCAACWQPRSGRRRRCRHRHLAPWICTGRAAPGDPAAKMAADAGGGACPSQKLYLFSSCLRTGRTGVVHCSNDLNFDSHER